MPIAKSKEVVLKVQGVFPTTKTSRMVPPLLVLSSMMVEMKKWVRRK
jgi:hypothetical protein